MKMQMSDLVRRDIIDLSTGAKIGRLCDFTVDTSTAMVECLIVFGKRRCFGLLRAHDDIVIPWCDVKMFGKDTILITRCPDNLKPRKRHFLREILELFK